MKELFARATFSPCGKYRYTLARDLDPLGLELRGVAAWCGLNPSTADAEKSDPTCTREMNYTRAWGYRQYLKVNAYAWRDTDPRGMKAAHDPVGPDNDSWLIAAVKAADIFVLCWGNHATHCNRDTQLLRLLRPYSEKLHILKLTKGGSPAHPLYLPADLRPVPFSFGP